MTMVFGDNNIQNNNNVANPVQNTQVTVESPPESRPWFGNEKIERCSGYAAITALIALAIYLLIRTVLHIAKARRSCARRNGKHHRRHHRHNHLSDNDNDSVSDSPHPAESLAGSDLSDRSPVSSPRHASDLDADNDSKLNSSAAAAATTDSGMTGRSTPLGATDGTYAVSNDSGAEVPPVTDSSSAASAEADRFMDRRIDAVVATTAPATPSLLPSCCVQICNRVPIPLRWALAVLVVVGVIYWYWFSIVQTGSIVHWVIDAQAAVLHQFVTWGVPVFMHPSEIVNLFYYIWYYGDYVLTHSLKLKLLWATLFVPFLIWLCPCLDRRPKVHSE